jgi:predicted nucleotidyltransferase
MKRKLEDQAVAVYVEKLRELKPLLSERYHVVKLSVFGSFVRDEQEQGSDLDVLVTFSQAPGLLAFASLKNLLSDILEVDVDLVMEEALKPEIGKRILEEVVPV